MHSLGTVLGDLLDGIQLAKITEQQYRRSVQRFEEYLGQTGVCADLSTQNVNGYLRWLEEERNFGAVSIANHRIGICRIWRHAATLGLCHPPDTSRIRKQRTPRKPVKPWNDEEIAALIQTAESMPGQLSSGIPASLYLTARLRLGYDTGLRPSDLRLLTWDCVDWSSGTITLVQHKTGNVHTSLFGDESASAMRALLPYGQPLVLPAGKWAERRWEQILFDRTFKLFGWHPAPRQGLGTLRKCHATSVYRIHGIAAAAESLGHYGSISTARRHYVDSSLHHGYLPGKIK